MRIQFPAITMAQELVESQVIKILKIAMHFARHKGKNVLTAESIKLALKWPFLKGKHQKDEVIGELLQDADSQEKIQDLQEKLNEALVEVKIIDLTILMLLLVTQKI